MKKSKAKSFEKNNYGYLFISPFFIVFAIFGLFPILYTLYLSFTSYDGFTNASFIGLANYTRVLKDAAFYEALRNTLIMWLIGVVPQMIFAFLLATIFHYTRDLKARGFLRAVYYLPRLVTAVSISALFRQFLGFPKGLVNQLMLNIGWISAPINFLNEPRIAQGTVGVMHWWMFFGNTMIMIMAGMTSISHDLYEAAKIDGANSWQSFWKITIPLLKPVTLYVFLTSLIGGLQSFDVQQILTGGYGAPQNALNSVVLYLYNTAFRYNNFGYSAAIAYYLFAFIAAFSIFMLKSRLGDEKERS